MNFVTFVIFAARYDRRSGIGTVIALMRLSGKPWLAVPAAAYVNTLRSIPLVMVILWFFLLIPLVTGKPLGAEWSAVITFTVFEAAYYSEIMRAGIQSVPKGQVHAGYAVGMTLATSTLSSIIPPSILVVIAGSIANQSIGLLLIAGLVPGLFIAFALMAAVGQVKFPTIELHISNPARRGRQSFPRRHPSPGPALQVQVQVLRLPERLHELDPARRLR